MNEYVYKYNVDWNMFPKCEPKSKHNLNNVACYGKVRDGRFIAYQVTLDDTGKEYTFVSSVSYNCNDKVLVKTVRGFTIGTIVSDDGFIDLTHNDYDYKPIVCGVDLNDYESDQKEVQEAIDTLKTQKVKAVSHKIYEEYLGAEE